MGVAGGCCALPVCYEQHASMVQLVKQNQAAPHAGEQRAWVFHGLAGTQALKPKTLKKSGVPPPLALLTQPTPELLPGPLSLALSDAQPSRAATTGWRSTHATTSACWTRWAAWWAASA